MKKRYVVKPPSKRILRKYWNEMEKVSDIFYGQIQEIEKRMEKETGIKGIEFFSSDGSYCGIGNADRTMPLVPMW